MKRLVILLPLLLGPGCASFGHGVWTNRAEVFARLDHVELAWKEAGGTLAGASIAPFVQTGNALLFLLFAGFSGAAHATQAPLEALGIAGKCEGCESRPASQPAQP